jgi:hypothetical protein
LAKDHIDRIEELKFVINELIPYLRALDIGDKSIIANSQQLEEALGNTVRKANNLRCCLESKALQPISPQTLQKIFGVPCAVLEGKVMPLQAVTTPCGQVDVTINGIRYRLHLDQVRQLKQVLLNIEKAIRNGLSNCDGIGSVEREAAASLLLDINNLIILFRPVDKEHYKVIYHDRYHQVHYGRGYFVLVRGPVYNRITRRVIYAALNITVKMRGRWLTVGPHCSDRAQGFWTAAGIPTPGGMCMGKPQQYRQLRRQGCFTDAEAIVQWMDAGVIIATGTTAFHKAWRARRQRRLTRQVGLGRKQY